MTAAPLAGCNVLVTRPAEQAAPLCNAIEAAGGSAVRFPVFTIEPQPAEEIAQGIASLPAPDIAIFASRNAVTYGVPHFESSSAKVGAIGEATTAALRDDGIKVSIDPGQGFTSEHLLTHEALQDVDGKRVLIVRGTDGRPFLGDTLRARGAAVDYLPVYHRAKMQVAAADIAALLGKWQTGGVDCVTILSVATLENLIALMPPEAIELLRKTPLVAPGERVIQTAGKLVPGIPAIQAPGPRPQDIVSTLIDWRSSGKLNE